MWVDGRKSRPSPLCSSECCTGITGGARPVTQGPGHCSRLGSGRRLLRNSCKRPGLGALGWGKGALEEPLSGGSFCWSFRLQGSDCSPMAACLRLPGEENATAPHWSRGQGSSMAAPETEVPRVFQLTPATPVLRLVCKLNVPADPKVS